MPKSCLNKYYRLARSYHDARNDFIIKREKTCSVQSFFLFLELRRNSLTKWEKELPSTTTPIRIHQMHIVALPINPHKNCHRFCELSFQNQQLCQSCVAIKFKLHILIHQKHTALLFFVHLLFFSFSSSSSSIGACLLVLFSGDFELRSGAFEWIVIDLAIYIPKWEALHDNNIATMKWNKRK